MKFARLSTSVPSYVEVDFLTMSAFIVADRSVSKQDKITNNLLHRVNIFKNYN